MPGCEAVLPRRHDVDRCARRARLHRKPVVDDPPGAGVRRSRAPRRAAPAARTRHHARRHADHRLVGLVRRGSRARTTVWPNACRPDRGDRAQHGRHAHAVDRARTAGRRSPEGLDLRQRRDACPSRAEVVEMLEELRRRRHRGVAGDRRSTSPTPTRSRSPTTARRCASCSRSSTTASRRSPTGTAS